MHSHNKKSTDFVKRLSINVGKHNNNNGVGIDPEVEKTVKNFTKSNKSLEGAFQGRST